MSNSGGCLYSGDVFSGEFPTFRLLVVDDDKIYLKILEEMLKKCQYEVTTCDRAEVALSLLREDKKYFDLIIRDVHMPDMDGFELVEQIALEMDLSVIMMSMDDSRSVVLKGVIRGAHDYLIRPVSIDALKNIWQHIARQKKDEWKSKSLDQSGNGEQPKEVEYSRVANEERLKRSKRRMEERSDTDAMKKARTVWSPELHKNFVQAINHLGIDRAVPKKILELMNVPWLKREHVASHLQKHRLQLQKYQSVNNDGTLSNHLQALASIGQLPTQNFGTWSRPTTTKSPIAEQINHFNFEMLRYQSQQQMNSSHMLYEEQNPSFLGMNMPIGHISQPQLQAQNMLSEYNKVLLRNGLVHNAQGSMYNQVPQSSSSAVDFSLNQNISLAGCNFPLIGNSVMSATTEEVNSDNNFNELYPQNDGSTFDNDGSTFDTSYINNGILSMEQSGQNINAPEVVLSNVEEIGPIGCPHINDESYLGSSYQSTIFPEPFGHDLINVFLEQQQEESIEPVE